MKEKIIAIILIIILIIGGIWYVKTQENNKVDSVEILENMEKEMESNNTEKNEIIEEKEMIAIHITGEVKKKGLIYVEKGARIADAIEAAGGTTKNANLDQINLAYVLKDGQKIYIPNKKEKTEAYITTNSGNNVLVEEGKNTSEKGENKKVNINTADEAELETLTGIGPALAQRIIEYREANGKFEKIEDIKNVKGIGDSKYSNIKNEISIK